MASDLEEAIAAMPLSDTHEHLCTERHYVGAGPDLLQAIFDHKSCVAIRWSVV